MQVAVHNSSEHRLVRRTTKTHHQKSSEHSLRTGLNIRSDFPSATAIETLQPVSHSTPGCIHDEGVRSSIIETSSQKQQLSSPWLREGQGAVLRAALPRSQLTGNKASRRVSGNFDILEDKRGLLSKTGAASDPLFSAWRRTPWIKVNQLASVQQSGP